MNTEPTFDIFLVTAPGLEQALCQEAQEKGFAAPTPEVGGVTVQGGWPEVWRAHLELRGAARILARIGSFRVMHLAQLDKRARKFPWADVLRKDVPVKVEVTCKASRIYHAGAATQRIETAIRESLGAPIAADAEVRLKVRIADDLCTISVDCSGDSLHKRGHKEAIGKAPMRENLAALFLRQCGYTGTEPVVDPMCGSGTFVIEAAEIAAGLNPGRSRHFAFEQLASFDDTAWQAMRGAQAPVVPTARFYGSDRDAGAIRMSRANAERAGVSEFTDFQCHSVSDLKRPDGPPGLVIVNPPYGARIGDRKLLYSVYGALGKTLLAGFRGWRVGMVTSDAALAKASGLPFVPPGPPVAHGGLRVTLFQTGPLS
ncbi:THUMP domain-containing class I SAM-dependent RNA methyltransferase [Thalassovita taeanensis]|uniref:Putative N6-adenine-specific DNA methylase n=1 Tax=Thalassovita taeanensis TaxID=657014 RepID=A0A1H9IKJ5_9RHOB|nr:RNA methyltransferase [Thalassovita taeanensis]SEQ75251.1 putative N6-adenine-specific DNA methylase [Thalassovita taeanensis]